MIAWGSSRQVSRKVATPGGTCRTISAISSSAIGPGPLGMAETKPIAAAPARTASRACSIDAIQQIFTRVGTGIKVTLLATGTYKLKSVPMAQTRQPPNIEVQRVAMKRLDFLVGEWSGQAFAARGPG